METFKALVNKVRWDKTDQAVENAPEVSNRSEYDNAYVKDTSPNRYHNIKR